MTRDTSHESYASVRPALPRLQALVLQALIDCGPMTRSELDKSLAGPGEVNPSYHKRLSELERLGLVRAGKRRPCRVSGRTCIEWEPSSGQSFPPPKISWKQRALDAEKTVIELRGEIARIHASLGTTATYLLRGETDSTGSSWSVQE